MIEVREFLLDLDLFRKKSNLSTQLIGHAQINRNIINRVITTSHHIDRIGLLCVSVEALYACVAWVVFAVVVRTIGLEG